MSMLETARLILRPPVEEDIPAFTGLLADYVVVKNLSRVPHPYTEEDGRAFIVRSAAARVECSDYAFIILRKADRTAIGMCGLHPAQGWEFGYWLGKPYWGQGYATEAAARLVAHAFAELGAESLNAKWFFDNPASARVLEKLGCVADGDEMSNCLSRGVKVFCHKMVLTRTAFERRKDRP